MSNVEQRNTVPAGIQKSANSPAGFIDSTYRAAEAEVHQDKPSIGGPGERIAYVCSAEGGSLSSVLVEDGGASNRVGPRVRLGGGIREKVRGFSRTSRRNLLRRFARINRTAFRTFNGRVFFVTVTCPDAADWPCAPDACKRFLKALRKRLERRFGKFAGFWRMGIQGRGALHFHLILFVPPSFGTLSELRRFVAQAWHRICGEVSGEHLRAGTNVEAVRKWQQMTSRAERYTAREEEFPEGLQTGRVWGVWNEVFLPVQWERIEVSLNDAYKIRRAYRKLAGRRSRGGLPRITVFVQHDNVVRLLDFLGYSFE